MYHYLGRFHLYKTAKFVKYSGLRCPCEIDSAYFDCQINLVDLEQIAPGESAEVEIIFIAIDLVTSLIQIGNHYQICEASWPIGEIFIDKDPWHNIESWACEGEIRKAFVKSVFQSVAGISMDSISIEGGIETCLMSEDVGLQEWDDINKVLKEDEFIRVRIDKIDKVCRQIKVSLIDRASDL
jgi:hypothetical protein